MGDLFMGKDTNFWLTLKETADIANTTSLIQEIADLRAKVSFYESRIFEMERFRAHLDKSGTLS